MMVGYWWVRIRTCASSSGRDRVCDQRKATAVRTGTFHYHSKRFNQLRYRCTSGTVVPLVPLVDVPSENLRVNFTL